MNPVPWFLLFDYKGSEKIELVREEEGEGDGKRKKNDPRKSLPPNHGAITQAYTRSCPCWVCPVNRRQKIK